VIDESRRPVWARRSPFRLGSGKEGSVVAPTEEWYQQVIDREAEDVELVLLEEAGNRRKRIVRLYIDHPGGVTHDLCARVSAAVGRALDEVDAFEGAYTLEVSSPGIERPLRKRSHFEAQIGNKVYVKTREPIEGSKVWQGVLLEVGEDAVIIEEAGRRARIPLEAIASAHLVYEY
jgi:ribosome maturation factor RimP